MAYCKLCKTRMKINCVEYCSVDCKRDFGKKEESRPLNDFDFSILKRQKRDGLNKDKLKLEFNVSMIFLDRLMKRADKHLTDTQLKNLYLD